MRLNVPATSKEAIGSEITSELVGRLFRSRVGAYLMLGAILIPAHYSYMNDDRMMTLVVTVATVATAFARVVVAEAYAAFGTVMQSARLQMFWQILYASAAIPFSIAITILAACAFLDDDAWKAGWMVSIVIACCYGSIPYVAVRPWIGVPQLSIPPVGLIAAIMASDFDLRLYYAISMLIALMSILIHLRLQGTFAMTLIAHQRMVERLARTDPLTRLWNRRCLERTLATVAAEPNFIAAYILIDLDRFKSVNDTYGHRIGDRVLCFAAERLQQTCGPDAFVARIGGDEFAVLLPVPVDVAQAISDHIQERLSRPFDVDGLLIEIGGSVGVSAVEPGDTLDGVSDRADIAMYACKMRSSSVGRPTASSSI